MKWGFPVSISVIIWSLIGLFRFTWEQAFYPMKREYAIRRGKKDEVFIINTKNKKENVAICLPAKNEAAVISHTIRSLKKLVPARQIYVISDGSTDGTEKIAESHGCNVLVNKYSIGKARSLEKVIRKFKLLNKYLFILFVDADTEINPEYVKNALHVFKDPKVVAIAGYAKSKWTRHYIPRWQYFFVAHRLRLYQILQLIFSYGQTWKYTNFTPVIPGFASMYRTKTLKKLKIAVPGLLIEDFNLAFQIHKNNLGKIAHHYSMYGTAKDPIDMESYINQVKRWNIGFFQTTRKYGIWLSPFWLSLGFFILEVFLSAFLFSIYPIILLLIFLGLITYQYFIDPSYIIPPLASELLTDMLIAAALVFIVDYVLTLYVSVKEKKPLLLIYGVGFFFFRILDAIILFSVLPRAFRASSGTWISPKRT